MTLTRWILAGVVALVVSVSVAVAQTPDSCPRPAGGCAGQPACGQPSQPATWARLFEAVAQTQEAARTRNRGCATAEAGPARLVQMSRFYYSCGNYGAAEFCARLALRQTPDCAEAHYARVVASLAGTADAHGGEQPCEPCRGAGEPEVSKICVCGKDCPCAGECCCGKGKNCSKDCPCGKEAVSAPACPRVGMCGGGDCPTRAAVISRQVRATPPCNANAVATPAARPAVCPGVPAQEVPAAEEQEVPQANAGKPAIHLATPRFEVTADHMRTLPDGQRVLFHGNVNLQVKMDNQPALIQAERVILNVATGAYEVNGTAAVRERLTTPVGVVVPATVPGILPAGYQVPLVDHLPMPRR